MDKKEIAVFGGAFDPPTRAHEAIMAACLERPDIDEVWLLPSGQRPDKPTMSDDATRRAMLELVKQSTFSNEPRLVVSDFEQKLGQPNETRRTTAALGQAHPDNRFWYVFGADTYHRMPTWEGGAAMRQRLGMLLVARSGFELPQEDETIRHLVIPSQHQAASSTYFREALQANRPVEAFVGQTILRFIREQELYASEIAIQGKI